MAVTSESLTLWSKEISEAGKGLTQDILELFHTSVSALRAEMLKQSEHEHFQEKYFHAFCHIYSGLLFSKSKESCGAMSALYSLGARILIPCFFFK
jgi:hypothetical protein